MCGPEELCSATVSVSVMVDCYFWHLHSSLAPLAKSSSFSVDECDVRQDAHKTTTGAKTLQLFGKMGQLTQQWTNNVHAVMSVLEAQVGYECALLSADDDTKVRGFDTELDAALRKANDDKPILQAAMQSLHKECCSTKVVFAKSNVDWVKKAVALPNQGKNRKPPVQKIRRPYPNM